MTTKAGLTVVKLPPKKDPPPPPLALAFELEELEALPPSPKKINVLHVITLVHIELKFNILMGIILGKHNLIYVVSHRIGGVMVDRGFESRWGQTKNSSYNSYHLAIGSY